MTELQEKYESVCNDYLKKFCKKQGFEFEKDAWVNNDIGGIVMVNDMFINFSDIVWDVNSKQPKGVITSWYYGCLENAEYSVNYYAYAKGIRNEDLIKK